MFEALRAVERVASGAIGGFASFVAITADGEMMRAETQRGGTTTLFVDAETTGTAPPEKVAEAVLAGVTVDPGLLEGRRNGAAIYLHALVRQGERVLGRTIGEPNVTVEDRRIVAMSGQTSLRLPFQAIEPA